VDDAISFVSDLLCRSEREHGRSSRRKTH
jgi:hypothetical protein